MYLFASLISVFFASFLLNELFPVDSTGYHVQGFQQEADDLALGDLKRNVVHRYVAGIALGKPFNFDHSDSTQDERRWVSYR